MNTATETSKLALSARGRSIRKQVTLNSKVTTYWLYPATSSKSLGSVILLHGYRGDHHGLEAIAGAISKLDLYILDIPGFGESEPFDDFHTIERYAEWVNSFINALNLKQKPHLLGHSFGSIIGSQYASKYQGISSLILENPVAAPALSGPRAGLTRLTEAFHWFAGVLPESLGMRLLKIFPMVRGMSVVMTKSKDKELRRWIHNQHDLSFNNFSKRRVILEAYHSAVSNCVSDFAPRFTVPTLMMIGELDDVTSVAQQKQLFELLPMSHKSLRIHYGVGHLTHYEVPTEIAADIEDWVSEIGKLTHD